MEQVAPEKRGWNIVPVLQIVQTIPEDYCPGLYQSIVQVWWLNELWFKRYIRWNMHLVSFTHHDVTDLVNYEMVKMQKTWITWKQNITISQNKKILNLCLKLRILRKDGKNQLNFQMQNFTLNLLKKEIIEIKYSRSSLGPENFRYNHHQPCNFFSLFVDFRTTQENQNR